MSLILTIVGSVFAAIFLVGGLVLAYGTWHYFSLIRVARYKRGTHGLKMRYEAWGMMWLTATSGAFASVIFVLLTGSQVALWALIILAFIWLAAGMIAQDYSKKLHQAEGCNVCR